MSGGEAFPVTAADIGAALTEGRLVLVYQPIFDLQEGAFVGVEALIRWRNPDRGLLGPDSFIDVVEKSDLVGPVARWTLATACAQGAYWHDAGYRFWVSVNVSARQWSLDTIIDDVRGALEESRFDPSLLVLEFARSTLSSDDSRDRLAVLASLGVHRAIDDFVPGPGSLEGLGDLPVDIVKIDRSVIAHSGESPELSRALHELVEEADRRNLQVIAAGIEDAAQRERLEIERIGTGQGFLLSQPHEAEEIDRFLEDFSIFSGKPL